MGLYPNYCFMRGKKSIIPVYKHMCLYIYELSSTFVDQLLIGTCAYKRKNTVSAKNIFSKLKILWWVLSFFLVSKIKIIYNLPRASSCLKIQEQNSGNCDLKWKLRSENWLWSKVIFHVRVRIRVRVRSLHPRFTNSRNMH